MLSSNDVGGTQGRAGGPDLGGTVQDWRTPRFNCRNEERSQ